MSGPSLRLFAIAATFGALTPIAAHAACVPASSAVPSTAIDQFVANPNALLSRYPGGEGGLSAEIRNFAVSDGRTVAAINTLLSSANAQQRSSIGAGLGQAAMACRRTDVDTARQISTLVVSANNNELTTAYNGVTGDTRTTATGGGGGAGGGAGGGGGTGTGFGGGGTGSGGGFTTSGTSSFANAGSTFSSGTGTLVTTPNARTTTLLLQNAGTSSSPF